MLTFYVVYALLALLVAGVFFAALSLVFDALQRGRARAKADAWWRDIQRKQKVAGRR